MSLYTFEEVCDTCIYAEWHSCNRCYDSRVLFCHCTQHNEGVVDHYRGKCEYKKEREE